MRFEQLRYLDASIRLGSLRRAAESVGITQPSLTQQIRKLEEELNVVLLLRRSTGVVPTDAATALMPHLRIALQAENALHQEASAISGLHTGQLRLGTIPTGSELFVPRAVRKFLHAYPRVRFEVTEGGSGQIRQLILDGKSDFGIIAKWANAVDPDLYTIDILESGCNVCVPAGHALARKEFVSLSDLDGENFVVAESGQILREAFDWLAGLIDVRPVYQTANSASADRIVKAGIGIALRSGSLIPPQSDLGIVSIPLMDAPWQPISIVVARRHDEYPTPAMAMFLKLVREEADMLIAEP